jgi:hypothetical protein
MKSITFLFIAALLIGCKKPNNDPFVPKPVDDHELITSITLTFVDNAGVLPTVSASFRDPDGPGGNDPVQFDTIRLSAGATYNVQLTLENESVSPIIDVTSEILEAANEHFFCFTPSNVTVSVTLTDTDGTFPIGLQSQWITQTVSTGTMQIKLKHQTGGTKDGTCAPGGTDVEVNFITEIQ